MNGLPDLSSLTEAPRTAVAYMAQREAAALIRRALDGASDRIAAAIAKGGFVSVPIFHLEDIARIEANWSPGKDGHVSGVDLIREIAREEIDLAFPPMSEEEASPL